MQCLGILNRWCLCSSLAFCHLEGVLMCCPASNNSVFSLAFSLRCISFFLLSGTTRCASSLGHHGSRLLYSQIYTPWFPVLLRIWFYVVGVHHVGDRIHMRHYCVHLFFVERRGLSVTFPDYIVKRVIPPMNRWHWTSFFASGSTAVYVFVYSVYYFFTKTNMSGFLQTCYYFGYM